MENLQHLTSLLIGLIGWAATTSLLCDTPQMQEWPRRGLIVFTWMLWIIPAFDSMVYQGLIQANIAVTYTAATTLALAVVVSLVHFQWNGNS